LIARGYPLGRHEWRVPLELDPASRRHYADATLPQRLWVRLIRIEFRRGRKRHCHWLVTTLCDPQGYPRREIAELYRRRWQIETRLGEIKTTLQANVLRSKTPGGVRKELAAILLGHNVVWWLIHLAAEQTDTPPERISFAAAAKTILAFSHELARRRGPQRRRLFGAMLRQIARHTNDHPPGRVEPRLVKRDPVRYGFLRIPRDKARLRSLT
jgi:IS4 transposase